MISTLDLTIITPFGVAFSDQAITSVNVPSTEGYLGILPHHTSLFAQLTEGELKITKGGEDIYLAIGGGFMEILNNKVTILVTRAIHADKLNEREILEAQQRAEQLLKEKPTGEVLAEAQSLYRRSLVDLKVIRRKMRGKSSPPTL